MGLSLANQFILLYKLVVIEVHTLVVKEPDQGAGQGASVQGAGLPIHGCRVQNHWVSPRTTPIFILLRSIKMGTKIFWQLSDKK